MKRLRGCHSVVWLGAALLSWPASTLGDGGRLRAWKQSGAYDVAVFTDPSDVNVGPVDISVLLLDRETGEPIQDADVTVEITPEGHPFAVSRRAATAQAATNKLLRAAVFEFRAAGRCGVAVRIDRPGDRAELRFDLEVGQPWSPRSGEWPWILWPVPAIVLFGIHRRLVDQAARRRRGPPRRRSARPLRAAHGQTQAQEV